MTHIYIYLLEFDGGGKWVGLVVLRREGVTGGCEFRFASLRFTISSPDTVDFG